MALIVLIIFGASKTKREGGDEQVIKSVFVYLVLFATLMMTIGGSISAFMSIADIVSPTPYHQSFEDFKHRELGRPYIEDKPEKHLSEEELKDRYEAIVNNNQERQVARAVNSLLKSFGWIVIPLPVFIYFHRRYLTSGT